MVEIWKDIPNTDSQYQVSNLGNIRSTYHRNAKGKKIYRIYNLKQQDTGWGYKQCAVKISGKNTILLIHRIVAEVFVNNPQSKPCVNHIDGIKTNNVYTNLEWVSYRENAHHAYRTKLVKSKSGLSKYPSVDYRQKIAQYDLNGCLLKTWGSVKEAASYYGTTPVQLARCLTGEHKSHLKYMWRLVTSDCAAQQISPYISNNTKTVKGAWNIPINQYDLHGNLVKTWESQASAAKHFGCSSWVIRSRLQGEYNHIAFDHVWKYANSE